MSMPSCLFQSQKIQTMILQMCSLWQRTIRESKLRNYLAKNQILNQLLRLKKASLLLRALLKILVPRTHQYGSTKREMAGSIRPKFKKVLRSTTNQRPLLLYRSIKNLSISNKSSMKIVNLFSPTCLAKKKLKSKNFLMTKILIRIWIKSYHINSFNLSNISRCVFDFKVKILLVEAFRKFLKCRFSAYTETPFYLFN